MKMNPESEHRIDKSQRTSGHECFPPTAELGPPAGQQNTRIAVYTCIAGGYDEILPPSCIEDGIDYFCFTDSDHANPGAWNLVPLPIRHGDSRLDSRFVKMHPHLLFPDHGRSVYIDGNLLIRGGLIELTDSVLRREAIGMYTHPFRDCIYDEAKECAALGYDWFWNIRRQIARYASEGFPHRFGLFEANVILRRHHEPHVVRLMDAWWQEYSTGVKRDQLSLAYLSWKHGADIYNMGESDPRGAQRNFSATLTHKHGAGFPLRLRRKINRLATMFDHE